MRVRPNAYYINWRGIGSAAADAKADYLSVEVVSWFVNKESNWFNRRQAAVMLTIGLGNGAKSSSVSPGLHELASGARHASASNEPVLSGRAYNGGSVAIKAVTHGISKDTGLMALVRATGMAALGITSTMVQTATATGPYAPLGKVGATLVEGVGQLFSNSGSDMELFNPNQGIS